MKLRLLMHYCAIRPSPRGGQDVSGGTMVVEADPWNPEFVNVIRDEIGKVKEWDSGSFVVASLSTLHSEQIAE